MTTPASHIKTCCADRRLMAVACLLVFATVAGCADPETGDDAKAANDEVVSDTSLGIEVVDAGSAGDSAADSVADVQTAIDDTEADAQALTDTEADTEADTDAPTADTAADAPTADTAADAPAADTAADAPTADTAADAPTADTAADAPTADTAADALTADTATNTDTETAANTDTETDAPTADAGPAYQPPDAKVWAYDNTKPHDPELLPLAPFTEITEKLGISTLQMHGPCVAVADFDMDGDDDFTVIEIQGTTATIHTVLLDKGKAKHVLSKFDTTKLQPRMGCTSYDINLDHKPDLLAGGQSGLLVYIGDGKGAFVEKTDTYMPYIMDFAAWTIAPVDLDNDGDLDLFIGAGAPPAQPSSSGGPKCGTLKCDYEKGDFVCSFKFPFPETPDLNDRVLIRGAKLPMADKTKTWGLLSGGIVSNAMAVDVDADGKMDVVVGDDFGAHRLMHNKGSKFAIHSTDIGFYGYGHGMGWGMGDFNHDGLVDLVMADAGQMPVFVQTKPKPGKPVTFVDKGGEMGIWAPTWGTSGWSPVVADFDHDGRDDILIGGSITASASIFPNIAAGCMGKPGQQYAGHSNVDMLFMSTDKTKMRGYRFPSGPVSHFMTVAQVVLDVDGDGDLDIVQTRPYYYNTSSVRVLRNDFPKKGGSLRVILTGKGGNTDAIGSTVTCKIGGVLRTRWLNGSSGMGGTRSRVAHFGLGAAKKATDVTVTWPDGTQTKVGDLAVGSTKKLTWQ